MNSPASRLALAGCFTLLASVAALPGPWQVAQPQGQPHIAPWRIPARFIRNNGQWADGVRFALRCGRSTILARRDGLTLLGPSCGEGVRSRLDIVLPPELSAEPEPSGQSTTRYHFFSGSDPARWRTDVPAFATLSYGRESKGSGACMRVSASDGGLQLVFDFAEPYGSVVLSLRSSAGLTVRRTADDEIVLATDGAEYRLTSLQSCGRPGPTLGRFDASSTGTVTIESSAAEGEDAPVVSTSLLWSTYVGGSDIEEIADVDVADNGDVLLVGSSESLDVPVTPGAFDTINEPVVPGGGALDTVIARFSESGQAEFITYLGGGGSVPDRAHAACFGPTDSIFVAGRAGTEFPTTPGAFDTTNNSIKEFLACLSADGSHLVYSTLFGGDVWPTDFARIAVDDLGRAFFSGTTSTPDLPTTPGVFDPVFTGNPDVFVGCLEPDGSALGFLTYLGGLGGQSSGGLALGPAGRVYVGGHTDSPDFPVTPGAFGGHPPGGGFVSILNATGTELHASAILTAGGIVRGLAVASDGSVYAAGQTYDDFGTFPTTLGAFSTDPLALPCGYVTRFTPMLDKLVYSTFLSSLDPTALHDIEVDASGVATVAGTTGGPLYPTTAGALYPLSVGGEDFVVTRLSPDGSTLLYSTYFGGATNDSLLAAASMALDPLGRVVLAGQTTGTDMPVTPAAFDPTFNGEIDLVVAKLEPLPEGVVRHGESTPGCAGLLPMGAQNAPALGATDFAFTCSAAPHDGRGLLLLSAAALDRPLTVKGAGVWVDPELLLALVEARSDGLGFSRVRLDIPTAPELVGQSFGAQYVWPPCAGGGWSASHALRVTVQP